MIENSFISREISKKIITVGSQYINHRGGIGSVIETYSKYYKVFNFVNSYGTTRIKTAIIFKFLQSLIHLIISLIKDKEIEIVHIHGAAKGSFFRKYIVYLIVKYLFNKKIVFHCHGSEMEVFYLGSPKIVKNIMTSLFNNVDLIICLSNSWANFFNHNFKPKGIVVLENIIEEVQIKKVGENQQKVLSFLFMGAIGNRKGLFDLLEVITENKKAFSGKMKLIIGGNGEIKRLEDFISNNELADLVEFKGWVNGELKIKLFNEADVYILPSYNEGLPISILEAMSYGLPIISTLVGGIPEIISSGKNGCLINPGDKKAIYTSLRLFIQSPSLCNAYGQSSLEIVKPYFAKNVIPKLNSIYNQLLMSKS